MPSLFRFADFSLLLWSGVLEKDEFRSFGVGPPFSPPPPLCFLFSLQKTKTAKKTCLSLRSLFFYLSLSLTESTRRTRRRRWGWQGRRSSKGCQKSSSRVRKRRRPRAPRARARRPARAARAAARGMSGGWQRGSRGLWPWRSLLLRRRRRRWRPRERRRRRPSCCGGTGVFSVFFGEKVEQRERGREVSDDRRGA
jgi:hypothetical protein